MITSHFHMHHFKKRFQIVHQICHTIMIHMLFTSVVLPQLIYRFLLPPWTLSFWGPDLLAFIWPAAKLSVLGTSSARLPCWVSCFLDSIFWFRPLFCWSISFGSSLRESVCKVNFLNPSVSKSLLYSQLIFSGMSRCRIRYGKQFPWSI